MSRAIRPLLSVVLLLLTALGLHNVYADHTPVLEKAKATACEQCQTSLSQLSKSPISHTYFLRTPDRTVVVKCQRPYIFMGEYTCKKKED